MQKKHLIEVPNIEKVGVYAIRNKKNNKYYVGSSVNVKSRMSNHRNNLEKLYGPNLRFDEDLKSEEDIANFEFLVLETFDDYEITDRQLRKKETEYIEKYDAYNGYNNQYHIPAPSSGYYGKNEFLSCRKVISSKVKMVLPHFYVFHSNQVIRMPINTSFLILVNDKIRMFAEEP